jgi:hypothetical protein
LANFLSRRWTQKECCCSTSPQTATGQYTKRTNVRPLPGPAVARSDPPSATPPFPLGGVALNLRPQEGSGTPGLARTQVLYPEDLLPYTRKPFFLIVDSDNSIAFKVSIQPRLLGERERTRDAKERERERECVCVCVCVSG